MASRDRWIMQLKCSNAVCGANGAAAVSEDYVRDPHFTVDGIEGPFSLFKVGRTSVDTVFKCSLCGALAQ
jgi:hypothetical protein